MGDTIRVLLADDHQVLRDSLKALLELEPDITVVAVAGDGRSALRLAQEVDPDVVIMDVAMPELNGIDAARQLAASSAKARIICLSVHLEHHLMTAMLRAGASGYVPKTAAAAELVQAVRKVAEGEVYLSPIVAHDVLEYHVRGMSEENSGVFQTLTEREREVLQLIAEGHDTKAVAKRLCISPKTVLSHRERLMCKLGLDTTAALTRYALREGIVEL